MENETVNKLDLNNRITSLVIKKKYLILSILLIIITALSALIFLNYYQNNKNMKISEKYINAGIYLSNKNIEKSNIIYKDIIASKNVFYSLLSLNNILENKLEKNGEEILKLFNIVEDINLTKEQKNLLKLKKALYLKGLSKSIEGNRLLKEIIADNSIWKDTATEVLKN